MHGREDMLDVLLTFKQVCNVSHAGAPKSTYTEMHEYLSLEPWKYSSNRIQKRFGFVRSLSGDALK